MIRNFGSFHNCIFLMANLDDLLQCWHLQQSFSLSSEKNDFKRLYRELELEMMGKLMSRKFQKHQLSLWHKEHLILLQICPQKLSQIQELSLDSSYSQLRRALSSKFYFSVSRSKRVYLGFYTTLFNSSCKLINNSLMNSWASSCSQSINRLHILAA